MIIDKCARCTTKINFGDPRYCKTCKNAYMREYRKTHPPNEEQKFKGRVRSKNKMRIRRGLLKKLPCEKCGDLNVEAHHEDYSKPYDILWFCRKHHLLYHKSLKDAE